MSKSRGSDLLEKLRNVSGSFKWTEIEKLFKQLGYSKSERAGSRVAFHHPEKDCVIILHKPHPENTVGKTLQRNVLKHLKDNGLINE